MVTPDGDVDGSAFTISDDAADERGPRIAGDGFGGALVIWWRNNGGWNKKDLYGDWLDPSGQLLGGAFTILEQIGEQDNPALVGAGGGRYLLAWQDDLNNSWDIYASLYQLEQYSTTVVSYSYDPLYRLTSAVYTGSISAT